MLTDIRQIKGCQDLLRRISELEETVQILKDSLAEQASPLKAFGAVKRNTAYELGSTLFNSDGDNIDFNWFMECTKAGTTGAENITIPADAQQGTVITDGEVEWTLLPADNSYKYDGQTDIGGGSGECCPTRQVKTVDVTLAASGWNTTDNTYSYSNDLIQEDSVIILTLKNGATREAAKAYQLADVYCESQSAGNIKIVSYGTLPTIDITATIVII